VCWIISETYNPLCRYNNEQCLTTIQSSLSSLLTLTAVVIINSTFSGIATKYTSTNATYESTNNSSWNSTYSTKPDTYCRSYCSSAFCSGYTSCTTDRSPLGVITKLTTIRLITFYGRIYSNSRGHKHRGSSC